MKNNNRKPNNKQIDNNINEGATNNETWLDTQDILQRLHISTRTLARWKSKNLLPFSQIGQKRYYREADVQALLQRHMSERKSSDE